MKCKIHPLLVMLLIVANTQAQISVCSWNIANFGKTKDAKEIDIMANTIKNYDAIAIVEVVASDPGREAVERLASRLAIITNSNWGYTVSEPTTSSNAGERERYAFIWKIKKLKIVGQAWLEVELAEEIVREPFFITFESGKNQFTLSAVHIVPTGKRPQNEIPILEKIVAEYPKHNLVFCGDFNCTDTSKIAFDGLKALGFSPALHLQKTSLKKKCSVDQDCLANVYDNIFYKKEKITVEKYGPLLFYKKCSSYEEAIGISDHIPIFFKFHLN